MSNLVIGTGGVPLTSEDRSTEAGIRRNHELGLDLMELEFVYGVKMKEEQALAVRKEAEEKGITLTVHGPYYINLASTENKKFYGSIKYITDSVYIGGLTGAKSVTFHPGFFQGRELEEVKPLIEKGFKKIYAEFAAEKYEDHPINKDEIVLAPELTGKPSQFGSFETLLDLAEVFKGENLRLCIDFAHHLARSNGKLNGYDEYMRLFNAIAERLGEDYLDRLHMHLSGIIYSPKGERNHVTFLEDLEEYAGEGVEVAGISPYFDKIVTKEKNGGSDIKWREVLKAIKVAGVGGYLVIESPILELDALLVHTIFKQI